MKFSRLLAVLPFLLLHVYIHAQDSSRVFGRILDKDGKGVHSASVVVYTVPANTIVRTSICDREGNFEILRLKPGTYKLMVSSSGFENETSNPFSVRAGESIHIPSMALKPASKSLAAVTVNGSYKKPMIEVTADKTVFNVESSINSTGSNAFELLQKSPGVVTDKDDNITMKGKNGVRVYIDGRPNQMEPGDLAAYLKSINSVDIESIEMIGNPSAKYDASGNAGIINIKLKKNKKIGFNGNISAGLNAGKNPKTNSGISLNYRDKTVNLFSNYSNNYVINGSFMRLNRQQSDTLYDQSNDIINQGWSQNLKAGADFFLSKKSTLGCIVTGNFTNMEFITNSVSPITSMATGKLVKTLYAKNDLPANIKNVDYNLNYKYADSIGNEFNIDLDYNNYDSRKQSYQPNQYYSPVPETLLYEMNYRNFTPTRIDIYTAKIDYEKNLFKGKLGVGAKFSSIHTDNDFSFYDVVNGYDYLNLSKSNTFTYNENVNAAYINYNRSLGKKFFAQAGVRLENTVSKGLLNRADGIIQTDNLVERNYTDLFPSASLSFNANSNNAFSLSYSKRIDRPNYQDLNPFENKLTELTYLKGNAFLQPQYTNNLQLSHTYMGKYITSVGYSHTNAYFAQTIDTADRNKSFMTKKNMADQQIINANFSIPVQIAKWWNFYANINIFHSQYHANFGPGKVINIDITSGTLFGQNTFTLKNGFTGEISGFYNAPTVWAGTFKSDAMGGIDLGIQKKLFNDNGNLKLSFTDCLHTMKWRGVSNYSGANLIASGYWDSQLFRTTFTYRFGNKQVKQARERQTGSEEESKRAKAEDGGVF